MEIEHLGEILQQRLPGKTLISYEASKLTELGENYGSLLLALKIHLKNETLEAVAKVPPKGKFIQKMFNTSITFRNEINFYKIIVPTLEAFLYELGFKNYLDCFPQYYGARLNLTNEDLVDENATLLLENLKTVGYGTVDRTTGFDLEMSKTVLSALAKLHAVPIAMKFKKPDQFQKIKSLFVPYKVFDFDVSTLPQFWEKFGNMLKKADLQEGYFGKVRDVFLATTPQIKNNEALVREPYATIIHTDAWVNNFIIKGTTDCKIVDFQLYEYGSPARDVLFFMYSSIESAVVKEHYQELIEWYHQNFVKILDDLGCNTTPFSLEEFIKEMHLASKEGEFFHLLIMLEPIYAVKDNIIDPDEMTEEDFFKKRPVPVKQLEKMLFIIDDFIKKCLI